MTIKDYKTFLNSLPKEFDNFEIVHREYNDIKDDVLNAKLINVSDGVDLIIGSSGHTWADPDDASSPASHLNGRFTLSAQKNVELQYHISTSEQQASYQGGHPNQVLIWKIA
jgi:hypothetical protein